MKEKLWQEIFKCHQHKGGESIKPALQAEGREGRRVSSEIGGDGVGVQRGALVKLL